MTKDQTMLQTERLLAEERMFRAQLVIGEIKRVCPEHNIIKGCLTYSPRQEKVVRIESDDSVSCSVCGVELGWFCPKNPKQYCEYGEEGEDCLHCGEPSERK